MAEINRHKTHNMQDYFFWKHWYSLKFWILKRDIKYRSFSVSGTCYLLAVIAFLSYNLILHIGFPNIHLVVGWIQLTYQNPHMCLLIPLPQCNGREGGKKWEEQRGENKGRKVTGQLFAGAKQTWWAYANLMTNSINS